MYKIYVNKQQDFLLIFEINNITILVIIKFTSFGVNITIDSLSNLAKFGEKFSNTYPLSISEE